MEAQLTDLFYFVTVGKPDPKMSQKEKLTKAIDKVFKKILNINDSPPKPKPKAKSKPKPSSNCKDSPMAVIKNQIMLNPKIINFLNNQMRSMY